MKYVLGLDIGIASVGYGVINLDEKKIELMGVRCFEKAEVPKTGESPALARRLSKGARRTIRRRAGRMLALKKLITENYSFLDENKYNLIFKNYSEEKNPYVLRTKGLDKELSNEELVRVLVHIAKHRGFKSNRKVVSDEKSDDGKAKAAIKENIKLLKEKGYRTVGEMLYKDEKFSGRKRNSNNSYVNTLDRSLLLEEAEIILDKQKKFNNKITDTFIKDYVNIFSKQLPYAKGDQIKKMIGYCTLEKEELRAAKMSYTSERFMLIQRINNLKYYENGEKYQLSKEQKEKIINKAYSSAKVTYAQIKKELGFEENIRFSGISYSQKSKTPNDCEKATFVELKGNNVLKKSFGELYNHLTNEEKDIIANALTFYKDDTDIRNYLNENNFKSEYIDIVLSIPEFSKTANLSYKAMKNLLPYMEDGMYYSEAVEKCNYIDETIEKHYKLPVIDTENLTNPVMVRAISQVRKVINAIIEKYGSPYRIHIELAREAGKSFKKRKEIEKSINDNTKANINLRNEISKSYIGNISAKMLEKVKLYHEQNGQCAYSGEEIKFELLLSDDNAYQVDHILPYSRSFDNSSANKVLVLTSENQLKGNRTPYEYFGNDKARWEKFEAWINNNNIRFAKKNRLLNKSFGNNEESEKEYLKRNLTDTQYINRFLKNLFERQLQFAEETEISDLFGNTKKRRTVKCLNGQAVAAIRRFWGLSKHRDENDTHHAMDAVVIAAMSDSNLQNITKYLQDKETNQIYVTDENGEIIKDKAPLPWDSFKYDVNNYINKYFETIIEEENGCKVSSLAPDVSGDNRLFISRMQIHKATGALHKETIRAEKTYKGESVKVNKKNLTDLTAKDLDNIYNEQSDIHLYNAIKERMKAFGYNAKEAFAEPFYKLKSDGTPGNVVKKIKIYEPNKSGISVRKGVADNGDIVRSDIFTKDGKYYIVPVYTWQIATGNIPNKAIHGKTEESWIEMTENYTFLFSLYPYDLIYAKTKDKNVFAYYRSVDRSDGRITYSLINNNSVLDRISIGKVVTLNKYCIDILGNYHIIKKEKRK